MLISIGRVVLYRSRTGSYTVPAIVTATGDTLARAGVEAGHVPDLESPAHVHLTVLTPGKPGMRGGAGDFEVESEHPRSENVAGCYQEWDIPFWDPAADMPAEQLADYAARLEAQPPGTWTFPPRV
jgi:hypothetical protein